MNGAEQPVFTVSLSLLAAWAAAIALASIVGFLALRAWRKRRNPPPQRATSPANGQYKLISDMAHELRRPLNAIVAHAELIGAYDPVTEAVQLKHSQALIADEASRLARLVEDFLALSRVDTAPPQLRPVNIVALAEEALALVYDAATARRIRLDLQAEPRLPRVLGDQDRLKQVLVNLFDNGVKYGNEGGAVVVHLARIAEGVQVAVCDDGRGIATSDLPHIFEPLYRAENARATRGTGLGLAVVKAVLQQHGAQIVVESTPGAGATFRFTLPLA